jgi:small GTP-binding protein
VSSVRLRSLSTGGAGKSCVVIKVKGEERSESVFSIWGSFRNDPSVERKAPLADPVAVWFRGYELSLRLDEAKVVLVRIAGGGCSAAPVRGEVNAVGAVIALAGNPNTGKTSLFNRLTGSRASVGNWPGVTVERKEGTMRVGGEELTVVDLPGIYSLGAASVDEQIAAEFILRDRPDVAVVVVDASNLERSLYLVVQLLEMGQPAVVALNMVDAADSRGIQVDVTALERLLGVPVVPTVATSGEGVEGTQDRVAARLAALRGEGSSGRDAGISSFPTESGWSAFFGVLKRPCRAWESPFPVRRRGLRR